MADAPLRVLARGRVFTDWKEVTVRRSVLAAAGGFELVVGDVSPWPFEPPLPVALDWLDHRILTGYVEETRNSSNGRRVVAGRDRTCDLIDCDPEPDGPHAWQNVTIDKVASDLAAAFDVRVETRGSMGDPFPRFTCDPGEKVFAAIEKGLRQRGLLGFTRGDGVLFIATPSTEPVAVYLEQGVNLKSWEVSNSTAERFSTYVVRGQRLGSGDDFAVPPTPPEGRAIDAALGRNRPLVVVAGSNVSADVAAKRAQWEAAVRAAKAQAVVVVVQDWAKFRNHDGSPGPLWRVDELVHARIPSANVDSDLYVSDVEYRISKPGGTTAELTLVRPDAFVAKPEVDGTSDPLRGVFAESESVGPPVDPDEFEQLDGEFR